MAKSGRYPFGTGGQKDFDKCVAESNVSAPTRPLLSQTACPVLFIAQPLPNILKKIIYILTLIVFGMVHSQENKDSDCTLQAENKEWKLEFSKTDSKSEQIELIKQKLITDSIYREKKPVINTAHGRINGYEDENGNYCGCKILFLLVPKRQGGFYELNLNARPNLLEVIKSLNKDNIKRIFYMLENDNNALAPTGRCGIIKLTTTDEELIKRIKNVWQQNL